MGLQSAFFTAISGINATGRALGEIGNNIANAETTGYKSRRVSFGDLFGASIGAGGTSTALTEGRDRKSGSAGMPRPTSSAAFCLNKTTR